MTHAKFIGEEGELTGAELTLDEGNEWIMGRDPDDCQLLIEDPAASRTHMRCQRTEDGFLIENLSETNPIELNDSQLEDSQPLHDGDHIRVGNSVFRFVIEEDTEEEQSPEDEAPEEDEEGDELEPLEPEEVDEAVEELERADFDVHEGTRWLLKVVAGPNTGAEFAMEPNQSYTLGTDSSSCDIVFQDVSVSRQHARIEVGSNASLNVEDLDSRNGVLVDGEPIEKQAKVQGSQLVSLGTTAFLVSDREGEEITIVSPLVAAAEKEQADREAQERELEEMHTPEGEEAEAENEVGSLIALFKGNMVLAVLGFILLMSSFFVISLFQTEKIENVQVDRTKEMEFVLEGYPELQYSYTASTGRLLILGHVLTAVDRSQILYRAKQLEFVKHVDDNIVVDEYIWQENNQVIGKNPDWQGVTMISPKPGSFVLTGFLETKEQWDTLNGYLNLNFKFPALLEREVIVEEEVLAEVNARLLDENFAEVQAVIARGEITLTGQIGYDRAKDFELMLKDLRTILGIRTVRNLVIETEPREAMINLTTQYEVTGYSNRGETSLNVVINGRIIARGDTLDGMTVTSIRQEAIFLERNGIKYRIDYNR